MCIHNSTVYYAATACNEAKQVFSNELNRVNDWTEINRLSIIVLKIKGIIFGV